MQNCGRECSNSKQQKIKWSSRQIAHSWMHYLTPYVLVQPKVVIRKTWVDFFAYSLMETNGQCKRSFVVWALRTNLVCLNCSIGHSEYQKRGHACPFDLPQLWKQPHVWLGTPVMELPLQVTKEKLITQVWSSSSLYETSPICRRHILWLLYSISYTAGYEG